MTIAWFVRGVMSRWPEATEDDGHRGRADTLSISANGVVQVVVERRRGFVQNS
jgi:hypothetical protein